MRTAYDLLMTAPDDQITRCRLAHTAIGAGEWADAAHFLRNAAREAAGTAWGQDAAVLDHEPSDEDLRLIKVALKRPHSPTN